MITNNANFPKEGSFIINANTRSIAVPTDFSKNGVGVVGDHAAEALEFSIDRYFDTLDLANATSIDVRWSNTSGKSGIYKVPSSSITDGAETITFVWILTKEAIGDKSGNIKFNVRISIGDIKLNTQPQTIVIKAGLDLAGDIIEDDSDGALELRKGLVAADLAKPAVFATDLNASAGLETLTVAVTGDQSDYGDAVKATWYKDGEVIEGEHGLSYTVTAPGAYQVVLTTSKRIIDETATTIDGNSDVPFKYHTSIASVASTKCIVSAPAEIKIVANLASAIIGAAEGANLELEIERPEEGVITAKAMFKAADAEEFVEVGNAQINENKISYVATRDGAYKLVLTHSLNGGVMSTESGVANVILEPIKPVVHVVPDGEQTLGVTLTASIDNMDDMNTLSYQWYSYGTAAEKDKAVEIKGADSATYTTMTESEGGEGTGYYKVVVTNSKEINKQPRYSSGEAVSGYIKA